MIDYKFAIIKAVIYILHGKDSFRKQVRLDELKHKYIEPGMESLSFLVMDNPELIDFISAVKTPGFGLGSKLIVVKNFKYLENKSEDSEVEQILNTLQNLPESVVLVFDSDKVTGTIKLVKNIKAKLKSIIELEEFTPFTPWDSKSPASWLCRSFPKELEMQDAEYFVEQIGAEDSGKLYSEMKRLLTLGKPIDQNLIERECAGKVDIFKFTRLVAEEKTEAANKELDRIILAKETHLGLLAMMETSVSRYLKLKLSQGKTKEEKAKILGISPGRLYFQEQEVSRMQTPYLEKLLDKTIEAERNVKRGRMNINRALKYLVNS